jgi:hypothetical protein
MTISQVYGGQVNNLIKKNLSVNTVEKIKKQKS